MRARAIDFLMLGVADIDRAVRFYRDTLGMAFPLGGEWGGARSPPACCGPCAAGARHQGARAAQRAGSWRVWR